MYGCLEALTSIKTTPTVFDKYKNHIYSVYRYLQELKDHSYFQIVGALTGTAMCAGTRIFGHVGLGCWVLALTNNSLGLMRLVAEGKTLGLAV